MATYIIFIMKSSIIGEVLVVFMLESPTSPHGSNYSLVNYLEIKVLKKIIGISHQETGIQDLPYAHRRQVGVL